MSDWIIVQQDGNNEITKKLKIPGGYLYCHVMKWKNDDRWLSQMGMCFVSDKDSKEV